MGKDGRDAVRVTTTLSRQQYGELCKIAESHGVKLAWRVRRAVDRLISETTTESLPTKALRGESR